MNATTAIEAVEKGTIPFGDFLRTVAKKESSVETSVDLPSPTVISPEVRAEIVKFVSETLGNGITPSERRPLTAEEVVSLMEERLMIDKIDSIIKDRKDSHRSAIFNHMDIEDESVGNFGERDSKGHLLNKSAVIASGTGKKFTREIRTSSPSLSAEDLEQMVNDPSVDFTHDDYLACTTQVRALDEAKVLLHLRKRPEIVDALAKATKVGSQTSALYVRKG